MVVRSAGIACALAALVLASLALRPQLVGLGPLLPAMQTSYGVSHGLAGSLATVTVVCMAVFALPAVRIAHVIGLRAAMATALAGIVVFGAIRPLSPSFPVLLATTIGVGVGIGLGGALLPRAVRLLAPSRAGFATGLYSGGIQAGAAIGAGTAAPLAALGGDWRFALFAFAAATVAILVGWLVATRGVAAHEPGDVTPAFPLRSLVAWRLVGVFALNSLCYYGLVTWLPSAFVDRGWSEASAGGLVGLLNAFSLPSCFAIPWLSDRSPHRHWYVLASSFGTGAGIAGILLAPDLAVAWVALSGFSLGALFPLAMTLPLDVARRPNDVAGYAAMMLTGGYGIAAIAPATLGAIRDATGSFVPAFGLLVVGAAVLCVISASRFAPDP